MYKIINSFAFIGCIIWLYVDPSPEPVVVLLLSVAAFFRDDIHGVIGKNIFTLTPKKKLIRSLGSSKFSFINGQPSHIGYSDNPTAGAPAWTAMDIPLTPETAPVAVTGATNTAPIIITSAANHELFTGQQVSVTDVTGNTAANGNFTVTVPVMGLTNASNTTPIVITSAGHGAAMGNIVVVFGVTGNTAANDTWVITVIDANSFSLNGSAGATRRSEACRRAQYYMPKLPRPSLRRTKPEQSFHRLRTRSAIALRLPTLRAGSDQ